MEIQEEEAEDEPLLRRNKGRKQGTPFTEDFYNTNTNQTAQWLEDLHCSYENFEGKNSSLGHSSSEMEVNNRKRKADGGSGKGKKVLEGWRKGKSKVGLEVGSSQNLKTLKKGWDRKIAKTKGKKKRNKTKKAKFHSSVSQSSSISKGKYHRETSKEDSCSSIWEIEEENSKSILQNQNRIKESEIHTLRISEESKETAEFKGDEKIIDKRKGQRFKRLNLCGSCTKKDDVESSKGAEQRLKRKNRSNQKSEKLKMMLGRKKLQRLEADETPGGVNTHSKKYLTGLKVNAEVVAQTQSGFQESAEMEEEINLIFIWEIIKLRNLNCVKS